MRFRGPALARAPLPAQRKSRTVPPMPTLILIDLQQEFTRRIAAGWEASQPGAIAAAANLLARFRAAGLPIVHVQHDDPRPESGFRLDKPTGAPIPEVAPQPGERIVVKTTSSAFAAPGMIPALNGARDLIVAGAALNYCVSSTLRSAADLGYRPRLVTDATFCFGAPLPESVYPVTVQGENAGQRVQPVTLSAQTVHAVTLAGLAEFAELVTAGSLSL